MALSKWEGKITIPTGGWDFTLTDSAGGAGGEPVTLSLTAANTYYLGSAGSDTVDILARLKQLMDDDATLDGTYTVSISATTGQVTIAVDSGTYSLVWTDTDLRDLLGFAGNIAAQTTSTGANQARSLWLATCPLETPWGLASDGIPTYDRTVTLAGDGTYKSLVYGSHTKNEYLYQMEILKRIVLASEVLTNESYERWWIDTVAGAASWAAAGADVRFYSDATDDATFKTYNVLGEAAPEYARAIQTTDAYWSLRIPVVLDV